MNKYKFVINSINVVLSTQRTSRDVRNIITPQEIIQTYYLKSNDMCVPIYIMILAKLYERLLLVISYVLINNIIKFMAIIIYEALSADNFTSTSFIRKLIKLCGNEYVLRVHVAQSMSWTVLRVWTPCNEMSNPNWTHIFNKMFMTYLLEEHISVRYQFIHLYCFFQPSLT